MLSSYIYITKIDAFQLILHLYRTSFDKSLFRELTHDQSYQSRANEVTPRSYLTLKRLMKCKLDF